MSIFGNWLDGVAAGDVLGVEVEHLRVDGGSLESAFWVLMFGCGSLWCSKPKMLVVRLVEGVVMEQIMSTLHRTCLVLGVCFVCGLVYAC